MEAITKLCFLVPARITYSYDDGLIHENVINIDLVNRKVYSKEGVQYGEEDANKIFAYLDQSTQMPEDYYADRGKDVQEIMNRFEQVQDQKWETK
jgi:hypothetical protein